jgi:hypothetical protein
MIFDDDDKYILNLISSAIDFGGKFAHCGADKYVDFILFTGSFHLLIWKANGDAHFWGLSINFQI